VIDKQKYGPWAVITGGSDGTGAAYAREIAASGINLFLIARRAGPLEALASELRAAHGVEIETMVQDLNDPHAAEAIIAQVGTREVGLYVSNAGASSDHGTFMDKPLSSHMISAARWQRAGAAGLSSCHRAQVWAGKPVSPAIQRSRPIR
jgi:uncharacterized protein